MRQELLVHTFCGTDYLICYTMENYPIQNVMRTSEKNGSQDKYEYIMSCHKKILRKGRPTFGYQSVQQTGCPAIVMD